MAVAAGRIPGTEQGRSNDRPWLIRAVRTMTRHREGEGLGAFLFFVYAFLLLFSYYVLKTLREPLLLADGSAALKSYAYAVIATVLLAALPVYSSLYRRLDAPRLVRAITQFFVGTLGLFAFLGQAGVDIGFAYYVWVGVFGVMIVTQFWAHAADCFDVDTGQRVFPFIMAGATLGGLGGPPVAAAAYRVMGPWPLMLLIVVVLAATLPFVRWTREAVPQTSDAPGPVRVTGARRELTRGMGLVVRDHYLFLLALLVMLLNCVNSLGEYVLTDFVIANADAVAGQSGLARGDFIADFYGGFYLAVNALTLGVQVLLVARVFQWLGVRGALLIVPVIAFIGYGLAVFLPIFSVIRVVKILENSGDYSVMNTARHALYLPLTRAAKYEGKTAIDTFFWRFGDVVQAGLIFGGLHWLGFGVRQFLVLNTTLALVWIAVAVKAGSMYAARAERSAGRAQGLGTILSQIGNRLAAFTMVPRRSAAAVIGILLVGIAALALPPIAA